ncbi:MAG TPA: helix-turn-helix domain-containing protein [Nevskiaceae bacterium]|nr:helix-turn-helix domain-containing protein [Nevskiaceae bacterium]
MSSAPPVTRVAILAFPETSASAVYGMFDLFMMAGRDWNVMLGGEPGPSLFEPRIVARTAGEIEIGNGVRLTPHGALSDVEPSPGVVCIPEVNLPPGTPLEGRFDAEIAWLRRGYAAGATVATACSGAMLLAQAGLLDGHEATTHWAWCPVLREQYPAVKVREQRALVVSGNGDRLVMAGGGVSWLDLALYLIARHGGVEAAMQVARMNLIDWHAVGQQPFAMLARTRQSDDAVIARCQTWIAQHYRSAGPVAAMVRMSGLAERSFNRRFQQATGMSPLEYVHTLRMEEAKQMLETGDAPIEAIAAEVGYEDAGFFSRLFKRRVNLTPAQYRRRFGAMRRALTGESSSK